MADIRVNITDLLAVLPKSVYASDYGRDYDFWPTLAYRQILVVANVTETVTGKVLSGNATVSCTSNKYQLAFLDITPSTYKPGLAVNAYV